MPMASRFSTAKCAHSSSGVGRAISRARQVAAGAGRGRREAIVMACAYGVYNAVRGATAGDFETGLRHARRVIGLERKLRINVEGAAQRFVEDHRLGMRFWGITYVASQVVALPLSIFLTYQFRRPAYPFVRNVSLLAWAGGLVWYATQPVAPPRLVPRAHGGLPDSVSERTPIDLDSGFVRAFYNPIAAMPSLHVGLAPIVGGALGMLLPGYVGRLVAIAYPALVTISVIVTGNHYILDVVGGLAVVGPATAIAALISGPNGLAELHAAARW